MIKYKHMMTIQNSTRNLTDISVIIKKIIKIANYIKNVLNNADISNFGRY